MAVSFTTGIVITGFIPAIAQSMVEGHPADWPSVAWLFVGMMAVSGLAVVGVPETFRTPTAELGLPRPARPDVVEPASPSRASRT